LRKEITLLFILCNPTDNFDGNENGTPLTTHKPTAQLSYILTFVHVFRNELPYILESNPHPFYSFRGLKNQMRIRFENIRYVRKSVTVYIS
jgi:hypothetical protein